MMAKPFIYKLMGHDYIATSYPLVAGVDFTRKRGERKAFIPVKIENGKVYPIDYHGSAHINAMCFTAGFITFPVGELEIKKGQTVEVITL